MMPRPRLSARQQIDRDLAALRRNRSPHPPDEPPAEPPPSSPGHYLVERSGQLVIAFCGRRVIVALLFSDVGSVGAGGRGLIAIPRTMAPIGTAGPGSTAMKHGASHTAVFELKP